MNRIQYPSAINKHGLRIAFLFAMILVLAGFANADAIPTTQSHKGKGYLTITSQIEVEGVTLHPGDYEVKEVDTPTGSVVEFTREDNQFAAYGWKSWTTTVVVRAHFTVQAMSRPAKHTKLILGSDTADATGLEIRGDIVSYWFGPSQAVDEVGTTTVSPDAGQHE